MYYLDMISIHYAYGAKSNQGKNRQIKRYYVEYTHHTCSMYYVLYKSYEWWVFLLNILHLCVHIPQMVANFYSTIHPQAFCNVSQTFFLIQTKLNGMFFFKYEVSNFALFVLSHFAICAIFLVSHHVIRTKCSNTHCYRHDSSTRSKAQLKVSAVIQPVICSRSFWRRFCHY